MSGIKDVAALAKVSVPTVYKVFSNTYYTSPEIRKRVFDAAKELNYIPKSMKNPNKEKEAKTIAVFFDELVNPLYVEKEWNSADLYTGLKKYDVDYVVIFQDALVNNQISDSLKKIFSNEEYGVYQVK